MATFNNQFTFQSRLSLLSTVSHCAIPFIFTVLRTVPNHIVKIKESGYYHPHRPRGYPNSSMVNA